MLLKIVLVIIISFTLGSSFFYFTQEGMLFYPSILPPDFKYSFRSLFFTNTRSAYPAGSAITGTKSKMIVNISFFIFVTPNSPARNGDAVESRVN